MCKLDITALVLDLSSGADSGIFVRGGGGANFPNNLTSKKKKGEKTKEKEGLWSLTSIEVRFESVSSHH